MKNKDIIDRTTELAKGIIQELNLSLWDVTFEKEGGEYSLTVFIDKPEGVAIDDCEAVSRRLDALLDSEDYIDCAYTLCVSSAGIERTLRLPSHFEYAAGKLIEIKFFAPIDGKKIVRGTLKQFDGDKIVISEAESGNDITVCKSDAALCKTIFDE